MKLWLVIIETHVPILGLSHSKVSVSLSSAHSKWLPLYPTFFLILHGFLGPQVVFFWVAHSSVAPFQGRQLEIWASRKCKQQQVEFVYCLASLHLPVEGLKYGEYWTLAEELDYFWIGQLHKKREVYICNGHCPLQSGYKNLTVANPLQCGRKFATV